METEATDTTTKINPEPLPSEENEIDKVNQQNENEKLNSILMINTVYYVIVFVVIGLPIWYLTTSTYRSSLPFDSIDRLSESLKKINFKVNLELVYFNKDINNEKAAKITLDLEKILGKNSNQNGLVFNYNVKHRKSTEDEYKLGVGSLNIESFDESVSSKDLNILNVIVLDDSLAKKFGIDDSDYLFLNCLYLNDKNTQNLENLANFIKNQYLHIGNVNEEYRLKLDAERKLPSKKDLNVVNFDSEYEITFSLINENPEKYSKWNIDECIQKYFLKISDQLSQFVNFSIKAQTLLYSNFGSHSLPYSKLNERAFYYLKQSDLSIMTNYIESRLGSRISDSSALEFVTYVPSKEPLYIANDHQNLKDTQLSVSFLVPRWGGVYIYNPKDNNPNDASIKVDYAMKTFVTQFINLIGIELNKNSKAVPRSRIYSSEVYGYLLKKTLENQLNSINTLKSLSLLLTRINSMVIEDHIAEQVKISVESVERSLNFAKEGKLSESFYNSKTAFTSSERAFFDKSLLEKLYFPEDQRFAIYIPLFIPVGIPLVLSLKSVANWFKTQKNKQKTD